MNPLKEFMEAALGKRRNAVSSTIQFLKNDGKVLRFYCKWNNPNYQQDQYNNEYKLYVLHFFLADNTVEVLEIHDLKNNTRDQFPTLLKRNKLPKEYKKAVNSIANIGMNIETEYYQVKDFKIGQMINVFGRKLLLCDCDQSTKEYYQLHFNYKEIDFQKIPYKEVDSKIASNLSIKSQNIPAYNGFGSEEDSLQSVLHLMPKVATKNLNKFLKLDKVKLRYLCKFTSANDDDQDRRFIITFYLADDTLSVYEKSQRNNGHVAGKFLERRKVKNPDNSNLYYKSQDFYLNATLNINSFIFTIIEEDKANEQVLKQINQ